MITTTEEFIWNNSSSSPRLSFSQCLAQPGNPLPPPKPVGSANPDFDFNVQAADNISRSQGSVHADELFFKGMILPLPLKTLTPNPEPDLDPDPIVAPADEKSSGKKSFWKFGRSASFNCAGSGMMKSNFLRSYSTGTNNTKTKTKADTKLPHSNSLKKKKIWSDPDELSRASHVQMFPKEKGLIKILLCGRGSITECQ